MEMFTDARPNDSNESVFSKPKVIKNDLLTCLNSLSDTDIFEFSLLYYPSVSETIDLIWQSREIVCRDAIFSSVQLVFSEDLFIEVLYYMRKFRLLSNLGLCQHGIKHMLSTRGKRVKSFWKAFYDVIQDMDDDELCELIRRIGNALKEKDFLPPNFKTWPPEQFFLYGFIFKLFSEKNLFPIYEPLNKMGREDLANKLKEQEDYYAYYQVRCGFSLIINQIDFTSNSPVTPLEEEKKLEDRSGAKVDEDALTSLFVDFGYRVRPECDLTGVEIRQKLQTVVNWKGLQEYDIFILCILSHGDSGQVYGVDHEPVALKDLFKILGTSSNLVGKPKLVFLQACQGEAKLKALSPTPSRSASYTSDICPEGPGVPDLVPELADMFCAMSTINGHVSYRSKSTGSPFIQRLVENLRAHGSSEDIQSIMTRVNNDVAEYCQRPNMMQFVQMPTNSSTLRAKVKLRLCSSN